MEQNLPLIAKKMWGIVRVVFFMLRKGISKSKLMVDLNIMLKRGKIASKTAIINLLMLHSRHESSSFVAPRDYEFSCSNTPAYDILHITKRRRHHHHHNFFACAHAPQTQEEDLVTVKAVLELLNSNNQTAASPALPGFGRSPMVRQLRVTDSPFPLKEVDEVDSGYVDKAAEEFIQKFYEELRNQKNY